MDREIYVNQIRKVTSHGAKKTESRDVDAKALPKPTATKKKLQYRVDCFLAGNLKFITRLGILQPPSKPRSSIRAHSEISRLQQIV